MATAVFESDPFIGTAQQRYAWAKLVVRSKAAGSSESLWFQHQIPKNTPPLVELFTTS
jgi:hypothetical protein